MYLELPKMPGSPYRIEPFLKLWRRLRDSPLSFYDEVARDVAELGYFEVGLLHLQTSRRRRLADGIRRVDDI